MSKNITEHVTEFHGAIGQPVRTTPTIPEDDGVRLRLRLVTEEYCEFMEGHGAVVDRESLMREADNCRLNVDLVAIADACADLDYVVEGTRLCYGIPRQRIADAVHASNMAKRGGPVVNGKQLKPEGWTPPDIEGILNSRK